MNHLREKDEIDFAYKVRRAMVESTENIPTSTLERLAEARHIALSRQKEEKPSAALAFGGILAGNMGASSNKPAWFGRLGIILPIFVLIIGLYGIYEYEQQQQIDDLAEIDAAVLVDELPPDAYLDSGFNAYLNKKEQEQGQE